MNRFLLILFACACITFSQAQHVPATLSYQGILLQNDGITPLADGPHTIVFNFYDAATGGTPQFSRTLTVNTLKGLYTCILGDGTPGNGALPATLGNQQMFIGIAVNGGSELSPRAQLTTTPYAWMAQSAYSIADNAISTTKLVDGAVTNAKLAADIDAGKLASGVINNARLDTDLQDLADGSLSGALVGPGVAGANLTDGSVTSAKVTDGTLTNADINTAAAIADTKLATIATAGKVANSATSATTANTANTIVARDASGNFNAGTITANLVGNVTGNINGNAATVTTNANLTGDVTSVGNTTTITPGAIVDADINAAAAIADTKLATIATAGKVANSATSATTANTANTIVVRDASGNFSAGTVTANLVGNVTGNISGNAATVTTNANLTGDVTSVGNATTIAPNAVTSAKLQSDATVDANRAITTDHLRDNAVTNAKLATGIDAGKLSGVIPASVLGTGSANQLAFWNSSGNTIGTNSNFTWDNANSRLGFGTSTPRGRFSITTPTNNTNQNITADNYSSTSANDATLFVAGRARGTQSTPLNPLSGDRLAAFMGAGWTSGTNFQNTAGLEVYAEENFSSTVSGSSLRFYTTPIGTLSRTEKLRISPLGNVGIGGTINTSYRLDVDGEIASRGAAGNYFRARNTTYSTFFRNDNTDFWLMQTAADNPDGTWNAYRPFRLNFATGNVFINGLTAFQNGNVGISATSPQTPLHVGGVTRFESNDQLIQIVGSTHAYMGFYPDGFGAGRKGYFGYGGSTDDNLTIANEIAGADIVFNTSGAGKIRVNSLTGSGDRLLTANPSGELFSTFTISSGVYTPTAFQITNIVSITTSPPINLRYLIIGNIFYVSGSITVDAQTSGSGAFAISVPPGVGTMVGVDGTFANWEGNAQGDVRLGASNRIEFRWVLNAATGSPRAYHFICMGHF